MTKFFFILIFNLFTLNVFSCPSEYFLDRSIDDTENAFNETHFLYRSRHWDYFQNQLITGSLRHRYMNIQEGERLLDLKQQVLSISDFPINQQQLISKMMTIAHNRKFKRSAYIKNLEHEFDYWKKRFQSSTSEISNIKLNKDVMRQNPYDRSESVEIGVWYIEYNDGTTKTHMMTSKSTEYISGKHLQLALDSIDPTNATIAKFFHNHPIFGPLSPNDKEVFNTASSKFQELGIKFHFYAVSKLQNELLIFHFGNNKLD